MISKNKKMLIMLFVLLLIISKLSHGNELSLYGFVPAVSEANGYGWTAGAPIGGFMTGDNVDLYAGYWEPPISQNGIPQIATNALIFPSANAELIEGDLTNIIWDVEGITDDIDGTNLTITKISVHLSETTNEVSVVTNNINNLLGEIPWVVPAELIGGGTNYLLRFEVVDSSSLTNSRIFWDNEFTIIPEPFYLTFEFLYLTFIICFRRKLVI